MGTLDNYNERFAWVKKQLQGLPEGSLLLDAGCGSQPYLKFCQHLIYKGQDFGAYVSDDKKTLGAAQTNKNSELRLKYGKLE